MASSQSHGPAAAGGITVVTTTSPKSANKDSSSPSSTGVPQNSSSPKGQQQQCLCSPTTHQGSFRCRFHRSTSAAYFKRSKSMPVHHNVPSFSPKSVEST